MTTPGAGLGADVALVLVNYGSSTLIEHNLDGVDLGHARVVVVDNLTTAAEREAVTLLGRARGWDVLVPDSNLGFGSGMNLGVAHAMAHGATVCVLLNPDLHAPGATLTALVEAVRTDPSALVCPRIVRPDGSVWFTGGDVWVERGRTRTAGADATSPTGWLTGACLAVSSSLWDAAGGFDDDYFLYWEDVDLSWRVRAAGGHLRVLADVEAVHDVGGTQGAGKSATYLRLNARNRLVFAAKHLGRGDRLRWAARSAPYGRLLLRRAGGRSLPASGLVRATWAITRGTLTGLAYLLRRH